MTGIPTAEQAMWLLREHFFNRLDLVAIKAPWGKPIPIQVATVVRPGGLQAQLFDPLNALIRGHVLGDAAGPVRIKHARTGAAELLEGPFRIGLYTPAEDNRTRWVCLDFDGGAAHADALRDPLGAALETMHRCQGMRLPAYLERSGGGAGYHVWVFLAQPEPAEGARTLGQHIAPREARIEVFPKQAKHRGRRATGNMVWAPWWSGAAAGGNRFYRLETEVSP
jgi:hypothetical protein